ncbi:MAG: hypothetical protein PHE73_08750 [Sulfurovaceae bacterium]|nr:hypothetical protein [Sulfurovaceae bacterium]
MSKKNKVQEQVAVELSPQQTAALAQTKDVVDAVFQTSQQMLLAIEQILEEDFHFKDKDLKHVEQRFKHMCQILSELERKGLTVLSPHDMKQVSQIAVHALRNLKAKNSGIILPTGTEVKKLHS